VERLEGSALAKARLRAVLLTLTGQRTVAQACQQLGVSETRFHELRRQMLAAALAGLEPRPTGRPPRGPVESGGRVAELEAAVRALELELRAAQVREEIALILPHVRQRAGRAKGAPGRRTGRGKPGVKSAACGGCGPSDRDSSRNADGGGWPGSARTGSGSAACGPGRWPSRAGRPAGGCPCPRQPTGLACRPGP
jgi:transposase-like protein